MNIFIKRTVALLSSAALSMSAMSLNYDIATSVTNVVRAVAADADIAENISVKDGDKAIDNGTVFMEVGSGEEYERIFTVTTSNASGVATGDVVTKIATSLAYLKAEIVETVGSDVTFKVYFDETSTEYKNKSIVPGTKCTVTCLVDSGNVSTNFDVQVCEKTDPDKIGVISESNVFYTTGSYNFYYGYKDTSGNVSSNNTKVGVFGHESTDRFEWTTSDPDIATIKSNGDNTATLTASSSKTGKVVVYLKSYSKATGEETYSWSDTIIVSKNNPANRIWISDQENDSAEEHVVDNLEILKNDKVQLFASYSSSNGQPVTDTYGVVWSSSDESVVKVDSVGNVTAVGRGTATVKIVGSAVKENNDPISAEVTINVISLANSVTFYDETGEISIPSAKLKTGRDVVYMVVESPEDANENIVWNFVDKNGNAVSSDYISVEAVEDDDDSMSNTGKIKISPKKEGDYILKAVGDSSGKEIGSLNVNVKESVEVDHIKIYRDGDSDSKDISGNTISVYSPVTVGGVTYGGGAVTIVADPIDIEGNTSDDTLSFSISGNEDELVNVVDNGNNTFTITGMKAGKGVTVTIKNEYWQKESSFTVNVLEPSTGITLTDESGTEISSNSTKSLQKDGSFKVIASNLNDDKIVSWSSSDESKVSVTASADGASAEIASTGEMSSTASENIVTITAVTESGTSISFKVKVYDTQSIVISGKNEVRVESEITLTATIQQSGGDLEETVEWKSSNEEIATIVPNGKTCTVVGVGVGDVTISATSGSKTDEYIVTCFDSLTNDSKVQISGVESSYTYVPGGSITPVPVVKYGEKTLKEITTAEDGTKTGDYTVTYTNNANVSPSRPTITITGDGVYYRDFYTVKFAITAKDISDEDIKISEIEDLTYNARGQRPEVTVTAGDVTLVNGADYDISYSNNTKACDKTADNAPAVTITGKGNYTGTKTVPFTIKPYDFSKTASISSMKDRTYTGEELTPAPTVTDQTLGMLTSTTDYTVSYADNVKVGTATVTVTGTGNYTGTITGGFSIVGKSIENLVITYIANQTYTGSEITEVPVIKDGEAELVYGEDFTITYSTDHMNVGKVTYKITGIGNYSGEITKSYTISAADISECEIEEIPVQKFRNAPVEPVKNITYNGITLEEGTDFTVTYSNNITATKSATAVISGIGNFTGTKTVTFTIEDTGVKNPATKMNISYEDKEIPDDGTIYLDVNDEGIINIELSNDDGNCDDAIIATVESGATSSGSISILSVDDNDGKVNVRLSVSAGTAAGSYDYRIGTLSGKVTKIINIRVYQPATSLTITADEKVDLISGTIYSVVEGHNTELSVTFTPSDSTDTVEWSVSNAEFASISEDGTLHAIKPGTVTVTAKTKATETGERGVEGTCVINITEANPIDVLTLNYNVLNLEVGNSKSLTLTKVGLNADKEPTDYVTWSSSDESVATVDQDGKVTAVAKGSATIVVESEYGKTVSCLVNVSTPATAITVDKQITLEIDEEVDVSAVLSPDTADEILKWESSNKSIATVERYDDTVNSNTQKAKIKAVASGSCVINITTIRTGDGDNKNPKQVTAEIIVIVQACDHSQTRDEITKQATETESGLKDVYCVKCGKLLKQNVVIDPVNGAGEKIVLGDANGDGKVDANDAVNVLRYFAGSIANGENNPVQINKEQADINGDGNINSNDAVLILQYYAYRIATESDLPMDEYLKRSSMLQYA